MMILGLILFEAWANYRTTRNMYYVQYEQLKIEKRIIYLRAKDHKKTWKEIENLMLKKLKLR